MVLESVDQARQFLNAYAIHHNFAVKNGFLVKNKDQTLLLLCRCAKKPYNTRKLPLTKGSKSDNGLTRKREARSRLCDCPWMVRFKKQLNESWVTEGHQLEDINPLAYPENRPMTADTRPHLSTITSVLNTTYGLSLLGREVYNRTYDYTQGKGISTAKFIEKLRDEEFVLLQA
ncbi:hypothetical protein POJ06DRAFT_283143 [Lipomyces tetrasporus]|uniref:FAR1 domain-containing protein n=1 Tax=Lipomyces tetrasporus TaxID=54092 RepID=A0AAD7VQ17_9ASCO|nr:uncharacterized protein POJ06DRAFT_283143 [Lipomyces tetrasporus]KAJ8097763.1 hypothetical protein POJ06DRAFT_283143 [Lipomyces tetrasporus]